MPDARSGRSGKPPLPTGVNPTRLRPQNPMVPVRSSSVILHRDGKARRLQVNQDSSMQTSDAE